MTEPDAQSDALVGADGTQLPDPLPVFPDALSAPSVLDQVASGGDLVEPAPLPAMPDERAMREAIAAVLAEEPTGQARAAAPSRPGAAPRRSAGARPSGAIAPLRAPAVTGPKRSSDPSGAYQPVAPADLRRLLGGPTSGAAAGLSLRSCIIVLGMLVLVVLSLLAGFAESLSRLLH